VDFPGGGRKASAPQKELAFLFGTFLGTHDLWSIISLPQVPRAEQSTPYIWYYRATKSSRYAAIRTISIPRFGNIEVVSLTLTGRRGAPYLLQLHY
jgi:hypothetical protein